MLLFSLGSSAQVRISQVYGGGGNTNALYNQDFVELFNAGINTISMGGWSVQYASAAGSSWAVNAIPAGTSIAPGKYFLMALATASSAGVSLPTPDANGGSNISGTAGKVALVNNSTALTASTDCSAPSIIDLLGYGSTASCWEGSALFATTGITNAQSILRAANGCTDANNNSSDFALATASPRNTASAANTCAGNAPTITATPNFSDITTSEGIASVAQVYSLSAINLTPASGNISITSSVGLEISTNNSSFGTAPVNIAYSGGTLSNTPIYVRIAANANQGVFSGTVTHTGGGAPAAQIALSGGVYRQYYANPLFNQVGLNGWGTNTDGTGTSPTNTTTPYCIYNMVNKPVINFDAIGMPWVMSGIGSKTVIGNGVTPITCIGSFAGPIDVLNNATLNITGFNAPTLGIVADGSTVIYSKTIQGNITDFVNITAASYYNLTLANGMKFFKSGTTTVRGNLVIDNVQSLNGAPSPFSTVNVLGNITFQGSNTFVPPPAGDDARLTLAMNGSGIQSITGDADVRLFRLRRDSTASSVTISLAPTIRLILGNNAGGGLQLNQGAATTTILDKGTAEISLIGAAVSTNSASGLIRSTGGDISIDKSAGNTDAGTLRFEAGSTVNQFIINFGANQTSDYITVASNLDVTESLTLTKGRVVVSPGNTLSITNTGTITGGSAASFVDGRLNRQSGTSIFFPVGKGAKYAPVQISNISTFNNYTAQYFNNGLGSYTIDPITLTGFPNYNVSKHEYWQIEQSNVGACDITFHYTDAFSQVFAPNAIRIAHNDGTDWDDLGGTPSPTNTTTNGSVTVTGVSNFSPFTFAATSFGPIPVRLSSFTALKKSSTVQLNWITVQEINSKHFLVQRSSGNGNWTTIATIAAAGNSNGFKDYSFTDNAPNKGINLYRLQQVDNDGRADYSITRSVFFGSINQVLIAPHPAKDFVNVYVSKTNNEIFTVQLLDANGRLLQSFTGSQGLQTFRTSGLQPGLYIVKVIDGNTISNHKVMVL